MLALALGTVAISSLAQTNAAFDGRPWNVSSGNLSVSFIQASPIGAFPRPDYLEPPPTVDSQIELKRLGLVANEDYVGWGAVEREPGEWSWKQHDAIEQTLHQAGLKYVAYSWVHFPPVWLRDQQPERRTLMRCLEHGQEANYLSIFDPRTIEWYDHFYQHLHGHFGAANPLLLVVLALLQFLGQHVLVGDGNGDLRLHLEQLVLHVQDYLLDHLLRVFGLVHQVVEVRPDQGCNSF